MKGQMRRQDVVLAPARDQLTRSFREARRSGFLSLPAKNLTEFPPQVYHLDEHMEKDEKKWECVDLLRIDMSHNAIQEFSDEIANVNTLVYMKMCQNALKYIPKGFFELRNLTFVDFSKNQLSGALLDNFGCLVNLKELILSSNKIAQLPSSIGLLEQLEALRIEENSLTSLPESIGQLKRLHTLTAHTNSLGSLPASFSRLNNLSNLDLKKNSLASCDKQLATLSSLKFLDLRQNKLVAFPLLPKGSTLDQVFLGFNQLSELDEESILCVKDSITVFDIRDNKLSNLPTNIACLYKLKTLDLSNNDLSDLPPGLGYLKHLNHIVIDGNPLRAIRRSIVTAGCESLKKYLRTRGPPPKGVDVMEEEVDELEYLRREKQSIDGSHTPRYTRDGENDYIYRDAAASGTLDLSGRKWNELPMEITTEPFGTIETTLLHLNFSKNTLSHLPSELTQLINLKTLVVEENRLESLDPMIASQMNHLQFLRLKKNNLTSSAIENFFQHIKDNKGLSQSLKELDLRNNQLVEMPMSLRFLQALDTLQLSYNKLKTLDGFPFHQLVKTATISLSDNKLISLGKVYETPLLQSISFENNNITQVPCELGLCPHLKAIYLNGNPQKTVRGALIIKGSLEILLYLKNKFPSGTTLAPPGPQDLDDNDNDATDKSVKSRMASGTVPVQAGPIAGTPPQTARRKSRLLGFAADGDDKEEEADIKPYSTASRQPQVSAKQSYQNDEPKGGNRAKYHHEEENDFPPQEEDSSVLSELEQNIQDLEDQLENHSLSAPKRYALKKELAMLRSTKIREERKVIRK